uniref:Uncharacterized protein n=1 Tax=Arundo donax TaxID=35708 RepID=A0A0A9CFL4_ARUDO
MLSTGKPRANYTQRTEFIKLYNSPSYSLFEMIELISLNLYSGEKILFFYCKSPANI